MSKKWIGLVMYKRSGPSILKSKLVDRPPTIVAALTSRPSPFWAFLFVYIFLVSSAKPAPVRVILDTDMGNDIDDTLALAMLHALANRGEAEILAITASKDNQQVVPALSAINTFYGRPNIPVGAVRNGKTPEDSPLLRAIVEAKDSAGHFLYPRRIESGNRAERAEDLLGRLLKTQPDNGVVMIQIGFSTNLARLLDENPELVRRKVRLLVIMGGDFGGGAPEYNIRIDLPAAQHLVRDWPSPIVASGFEVGSAILYRAGSILHDFSYAPHHPVADAYRAFARMPYDRPTWDLTAVLYAVRPDSSYFSKSVAGRISVDEKGNAQFTETPDGRHRYLKVDQQQQVRVGEVFRELVSEPPENAVFSGQR